MKACPTCNRAYDDSMRFCLEDGATLVRADQSGDPTMTMPAQAFRLPPPPTLEMPAKPSLSTGQALARIFFSPASVFDSFREGMTFGPAAVRFLIAAAIIVVAVVSYNALYLLHIGSEAIARASIEASPRLAALPAEQKERALQMQQSPSFQVATLVIRFGMLIGFLVLSFPLGALIYWLGSMLLKGKMKYMEALSVWTYSTLPPTVIWMLANTITLFIRPPSTNVAIINGANGVIQANLGALVNVTTLPVPVYAVALSAIDLFSFYGLALAVFGLRKVARIPWIGSFGVVIFVWLIGVAWRIGTAGLVASLMK